MISKPLVLVADDEPRITKLVSIALQDQGFRVVTADSGEEALRKAEEIRPDVVLLDIVMPDIDGYEVVDQLRANPATQDATILILTGHELSAADRERLNGKVAEVLGKNGDTRQALGRWLERAAAASRRRGVAPADA